MENINLTTTPKTEKLVESGTLKLMSVLFLVILAYGGLMLYGNFLTKETESLKAQYTDQHANFMGEATKKVMDFQNRLVLSRELIGQERNINKDIDAVRAAISKGTYLASYKYDEATRTITLDCYSDNYGTIAKQILSFKNSSYFSSVSMGETKLDPKTNVINFSISLKIK
jgi:hypothetical protein